MYMHHRLYQQFKGKSPICGVFRSFKPSFLALDLELIKTILIRDFDVFHNRGMFYNEKVDPLSAHLFNIEDNAWKELRMKTKIIGLN